MNFTKYYFYKYLVNKTESKKHKNQKISCLFFTYSLYVFVLLVTNSLFNLIINSIKD